MKKPTEVNILGKTYSIEYCDNPSNVDRSKRQSIWGQIDFWEKDIRVYDNNASEAELWDTILHEVLHGIAEGLKLKGFKDDAGHTELGLIAMALADTLFRNGWMK